MKKLFVEINDEVFEKLNAFKRATGKKKRVIVEEALRNYLEGLNWAKR
ncbi:MAG: hypothetical protein J7K36_02380 [Archaeoglobaceae archaeon]|nr:hypothetical protein [Archaeoglobaceae archaeon]